MLDCDVTNQLSPPFLGTALPGGIEKGKPTGSLALQISVDTLPAHLCKWRRWYLGPSCHSLLSTSHCNTSFHLQLVEISFSSACLRFLPWEDKEKHHFSKALGTWEGLFQPGWHHLLIFLLQALSRGNVIYFHDKSDLAGAWSRNGFGIRIKEPFNHHPPLCFPTWHGFFFFFPYLVSLL